MDFHLKQWKNQLQHESERQPSSAKSPTLIHDHDDDQHPSESGSALPLFVPSPAHPPEYPNPKIITRSSLSAFPDSTPPLTTSVPRMGGLFSLAQWQELELQALIFRHMLAGAAVPPELLQPLKKSLLMSNTPPHNNNYPHHPLQPFYPPCIQPSWYWGRAAMDPEPGRCRRTDGKKWRCSRDVVAGQKYCERHVHRGRNRSRKPVETPITATHAAGGGATLKTSTTIVATPLTAVAAGTPFTHSGPHLPSSDLHLNQRSSGSQNDRGSCKQQFEVTGNATVRSNGQKLRHFFDDWPRSPEDESDHATPAASTTCLTISIPGNTASDTSLKLSTGNRDDQDKAIPVVGGARQLLSGWGGGWEANQVTSMGGPLAEALRSPVPNLSPTSVLHQLQRCTASESTSSVST
ncbi:growth-regulating factor 3 [Malania oleifera]|uniref:growth-regulating factor 3 n=1 Tax=Malania oleifera TaxID=397392 RepID=UPI0025ADD453|nr:growth-regulating factor 3 [Malania oleifera]